MSEYQALARKLRDRSNRRASVVLATVVSTDGSAYRRPGAWMTIAPDEPAEGLVSGGCLEADVARRAMAAAETGATELAVYDTRRPDDLLWGYGAGCQGIVRILIEPLAGDRLVRTASFFERVAAMRAPAVLVTALRDAAAGGLRAGDRFVVAESEIFSSASGAPVTPGDWPAETLSRAREILTGVRFFASSDSSVSSVLPELDETGALDFEFAPVTPRIRLLVCGAGDDAIPLARLAADLEWSVAVADHRASLARPDRFPGASVDVAPAPAEAISRMKPIDSRTAAVVLTHNLQRDVEWVTALLPLELGYLGVLGPRRRGEQVFETARGLATEPVRARRLAAPVGLDTAAETPREIAVSIVAEISAVLSGRNGAPLSTRDGAIHEPADRPTSLVPRSRT